EAPRELDIDDGDWRFLAWAHAGLVPLVFAPVSCCAVFSIIAGVGFVINAMARSKYARVATLQLLVIELALLLVQLFLNMALAVVRVPFRLGSWVAAVLALAMLIVGVRPARRAPPFFFPIVGPARGDGVSDDA